MFQEHLPKVTANVGYVPKLLLFLYAWTFQVFQNLNKFQSLLPHPTTHHFNMLLSRMRWSVDIPQLMYHHPECQILMHPGWHSPSPHQYGRDQGGKFSRWLKCPGAWAKMEHQGPPSKVTHLLQATWMFTSTSFSHFYPIQPPIILTCCWVECDGLWTYHS